MNTFAAPRPNPWLTIWSDPRATIRHLLSTEPDHMVFPLAALTGVAQVLDRAIGSGMGDFASMMAVVITVLIFGSILGIIFLFITSWLIAWTGGWIGGRAGSEEVQTAYAWASVPAVAGLVLWTPAMVVFGPELFTTDTPRMEANPALALLLILFAFSQITLKVYALVLLCGGVAEVQGFSSAWKGFGNVVLASVVLVGVFLVLGVVFALLFV